MQINSAVESIIIHTFIGVEESARGEYLQSIRDLCDTLEQSKYSTVDDLRNTINTTNTDKET